MIRKGFSLVELLVAIGLAALFLPSLVHVFSFSLSSAVQGENYTRAYTLAQENMEAIYYLKDNDLNWDWESYPENNGETDFYQPEKSVGKWVLGSKKSGTPVKNEGFAATVKILPVIRKNDEENDYPIIDSPQGPLDFTDKNTRKIIVKIDWLEKGVPTSIDLVSYVSSH